MTSLSFTCAHDVVIVGGGPAGATVGRLLARWGFDVVVIAATPNQKAGESIGPEAKILLEKLKLRELLERSAGIATSCDGIVSNWPGSGLDHASYSLRGLQGWLVNRPLLDAALRHLAVAEGAQWVEGKMEACSSLEGTGYMVSVRANSGDLQFCAPYLVDASGRAAIVARRFGAKSMVDDRLIAAMTQIVVKKPLSDPYLRFTATSEGWWYRTVGAGAKIQIATVADPRLASGRPEEVQNDLRSLVEQEFCVPSPSAVALLNASSAHLDRCADDRWLAVGDAAAAFDPLCGQGLANAFGTGLAAAHAIRQRLAGHTDSMTAYDRAVQATYRQSRIQLDLRYAFIARTERTPFWLARAQAVTRPR